MPPEVEFEEGSVSFEGNVQIELNDIDKITLYVDNDVAARTLKEQLGKKAIAFKSDGRGQVNGHGMAGHSFKEKTPQTLTDVKVSRLLAGTYD